MATRFYPQPITQPAVTPSVSAGWNKSSGFGRRKLLLTKTDANSVGPNIAGNGAANNNVLVWQAVGDPLVAQTISGTLKGQFRCLETNAGVDQYYAQLRAFVWTPADTVRGVLVELHSNALVSEFAASLTNRKNPLAALSPITMSSVGAQTGDRPVIEIGFRQGSTAVANAQIQIRDSAASDLPEDESATTALNSWLEFSGSILTSTHIIAQWLLLHAGVTAGSDDMGTIANWLRAHWGGAGTDTQVVNLYLEYKGGKTLAQWAEELLSGGGGVS